MRPARATGEDLVATEAAVIVPVPAADPVVREHRRRLDVAALWGVPAHVTVLYPFVPPAEVDANVLTTLAAVLSSVATFDCQFAQTRWFGEDVLWLDPEPAPPFRDLTGAVWRAFPQHAPYAGAFADPVPHLTVGERQRGSLAELRAAESAVRRQLPLRARIDRALLIAGAQAPDSWRVLDEFRLGPAD